VAVSRQSLTARFYGNRRVEKSRFPRASSLQLLRLQSITTHRLLLSTFSPRHIRLLVKHQYTRFLFNISFRPILATMARVRGSNRIAPVSNRPARCTSRSLRRPFFIQLPPIELPPTEKHSMVAPTCPTANYKKLNDCVSDSTAHGAIITPRASVDMGAFRPSSCHAILVPSQDVSKNAISRVIASNMPSPESTTSESLQPGRDTTPDTTLAPTLSPEPVPVPAPAPATSKFLARRARAALIEVTPHSLNISSAPNEANERRRAKKYKFEIQQQGESGSRLLRKSFRRNKLPASWDFPTFTGTSHKKPTAGAADGKDTSNTHLLLYREPKRLVCSPVYHIKNIESLEDVPVIQLEDRFHPYPTLHDIGTQPPSSHAQTSRLKKIDQYISGMSIQDQERGVESRTPDPFPGCPVYPFRFPRKVKVVKQRDPTMLSGAPRFLNYTRLKSTRTSTPAVVMSDAEMELYFDIKGASQS
jgi:hypothetical protein